MKIKTNGIDTWYDVTGTGPWLVLSHSLACNSHMWDPQMAELTQRYKVLRYDTRGHGQSGAPAGAYTLDQLADDAKALFDALGVKDPHWCGLSMGGMIGQTLALKYPGVAKSLVLADTTSRYPAEAVPLWMDRIRTAQEKGMGALVEGTLGRWFTDPYRAAHPDVMKLVGGWIAATPVDGYAGCCHALPQINVTDRLKEIKVPALVIVGEQDMGTPPAMARAIHEALPGSRLVLIPSAAHLSNMEQPAAFTKALLDFLPK
ncbi:MAG: 3-oxoadipate enol-lactonase [Burkholderiales bacterium]